MIKLTKGHIYEPKRITEYGYKVVSPKLNGIRAGYDQIDLYSYDQKVFSPLVLKELYAELRRFNRYFPFELDGELYVHGWPLQRINSAVAVKRIAPTEDTPLVEYHLFDCRMDIPYWRRVQKLQSALAKFKRSRLMLVPAIQILTEGEGDSLYKAAIKDGYEGLMYRVGDKAYTEDRVWHLLKRKDWQDAEFKIVRVNQEFDKNGKAKGRAGSLTCQTAKKRLFNVSSGLNDVNKREYWERPSKVIGKWATVKYLALSEDGIPLNLSFIGLRRKAEFQD